MLRRLSLLLLTSISIDGAHARAASARQAIEAPNPVSSRWPQGRPSR